MYKHNNGLLSFSENIIIVRQFLGKGYVIRSRIIEHIVFESQLNFKAKTNG